MQPNFSLVLFSQEIFIFVHEPNRLDIFVKEIFSITFKSM